MLPPDLLEDKHQHAEESICIKVLARYICMCAVWCAAFMLVHHACWYQCHHSDDRPPGSAQQSKLVYICACRILGLGQI